MNDILIQALSKRINADPPQMTIEQVPEPYKQAVQELVNQGGEK